MLAMLRIAQHCLAVIALLVAGIVGPETHVHQGEGPNSEALVHAHPGIVGHTHTSRGGLSEPDEGPANYINAYSMTSSWAPSFPVLGNIAVIPTVSALRIAHHIVACNLPPAHAPPTVGFRCLRAPPFFLPV